MKALTVCQPFAQLIIRGEKRVENREWQTRYRGPLLIHAGKSREWLDESDEAEFDSLGDPLVFGAIVGRVTLLECLHIDEIVKGKHDVMLPWLHDHQHVNGTWCWVFCSTAIRFATPLPARGAQGLWIFDDAALAKADGR